MNERRSKMRIFLDMLDAISRRGGKAKPTHILYGANLSHDRLKTYLQFLIDKGFIEEIHEKGRVYYIITAKGKQFINEFERMEELSKAFGLQI